MEWKFSRAVIEEQYRRMHLVVVPFNIISEPLKASYFALFKDKLAEVLELKSKRIYCIVKVALESFSSVSSANFVVVFNNTWVD